MRHHVQTLCTRLLAFVISLTVLPFHVAIIFRTLQVSSGFVHLPSLLLLFWRMEELCPLSAYTLFASVGLCSASCLLSLRNGPSLSFSVSVGLSLSLSLPSLSPLSSSLLLF